MPRKRYTEEQIGFALRQAEAGTPPVEICRRLGVSEQTFYRSSDDIGLGGEVPPVTPPTGEDLYYRDPMRSDSRLSLPLTALGEIPQGQSGC